MPFNYSTLWTFSQQAETKTKNKVLFFWGSFSFPRKMRHLRTSCETEQVKGQQQTNKTANNSSVLNLFLQWLFAWFVFFALCSRRFGCILWGPIAHSDRTLCFGLHSYGYGKTPPTPAVSHAANTCLHNIYLQKSSYALLSLLSNPRLFSPHSERHKQENQ